MVMRRSWSNVIPRLNDSGRQSAPIVYPEWMSEGVCAQTDPEAFFPETGGNPHKAKQLCTTCPVQLACLTYALDNGVSHGVWGGTSPADRQRLIHSARAREAREMRASA